MITFKRLGISNMGRLGNQLFQIASTIGIATKNKQNFCFPNWTYSTFFKNSLPYCDVIPDYVINENDYNLNFKFEEFLTLEEKSNYEIIGFFQSEKYFQEVKDVVRFYFTLRDDYEKHVSEKYDFNNSCSIHIRRTDYVHGRLHSVLSEKNIQRKYIDDSLQSIYGSNQYDNLYIFSDDINWCKNNLNYDRTVFIENSVDIIDLFLMSKCSNNIISNSTFSWWAAWLNTNEEKKITCPKLWLKKGEYDYISENILPENWIKIEI